MTGRGGPYWVRVVDVDVLAGRGVGWLPWAAADSSHRLHPKGWSHTDRATYAVWWGWSGVGAVMWQPPSIPTVWQPGQVFDLRPCVAARIRRVCGTTVVTV